MYNSWQANSIGTLRTNVFVIMVLNIVTIYNDGNYFLSRRVKGESTVHEERDDANGLRVAADC